MENGIWEGMGTGTGTIIVPCDCLWAQDAMDCETICIIDCIGICCMAIGCAPCVAINWNGGIGIGCAPAYEYIGCAPAYEGIGCIGGGAIAGATPERTSFCQGALGTVSV
jgi:hypothetical protein